MVIQTLGFDWSGVVSDDRPSVYEANMILFDLYRIPRITFQEWLEESKASASDLLASKGVTEPKEYLEQLYKQELDFVIQRGIVPTVYPDALEVFRSLYEREIPISVVSSHPEENLRGEAIKYELLSYIHTLISTRDKPSAIKRLCKGLVDSLELLYIGDTIFDIRSGKAAGVRTGGITTGYHSRKRLESENPDYVFNSLTEMLERVF